MNQQSQQAGGPSTATLLLWVMTSVRGRIGRQVYWLALLAAVLIASAVTLLANPGFDPEVALADGALPPSMHLINIGLTIVWVIIGIKRLHDFNASGLFAVFLIVPIINFFATILIGLIPGTPGPNRFGEHTDRIPPV